MASTLVTLTVDDSPMRTYLAVPSGDGPHPGVVVAQHAGGVDDFIRTACDRLAQAGFAAIAPDLYHRHEDEISFEEIVMLRRGEPRRDAMIPSLMATLLDEEMVLDMNAALDHLRSAGGVGESSVGVTGFCMGGRVAYLMATRNASLQAAACFYPGGAFEPHGGGPSPFAASDRITCHVMGFFGKDDTNPSPEDMERIDAELTRLSVEHTFHAYDGAAHAFMDHTNPDSYREESANDAWPKLVAFFDEKLKAKVGAA